MWKFEFTVRGSGKFPVDMLRYDSCYPADSDSATMILLDDEEFSPRDVHLIMVRKTRDECFPTVRRWGSFGWSCKSDPLFKTPRKV